MREVERASSKKLPEKATTVAPATTSQFDDRGNKRVNKKLGSKLKEKAADAAAANMSSSGKWREEQILVICPGSRTTMAQLGCNELTPPTHRFPTRMFRDGDEWRPYYTYQRKRIVDGVETEEWVEDVDSEEGAVWPIEGKRCSMRVPLEIIC